MTTERDPTQLFKGKPGPGRKKGIPNKYNGAIKDMIVKALDEAGGVTYLVEQARKNPAAFLTLVGKVLPMTVAGDPDNPLKTVTVVEIVAPGLRESAD